MSRSVVEAFAKAQRAAQKAFDVGDFETAFASLAADVEWQLLPALLETGVLRGRDAVVRYFSGVRDGLDWRVEAQEFIDAGEGRVVVRQRGRAEGRTTRIGGDLDFFQVWEVGEAGLVVSVSEYERREEALEAVGLRE